MARTARTHAATRAEDDRRVPRARARRAFFYACSFLRTTPGLAAPRARARRALLAALPAAR
jgi:hypothetical protein